MFFIAFLDKATEPYRRSIEQHFDHFLKHNFGNHSLLLAHIFICSFIFIIYHWALGLLNLIQIYVNHSRRFQIQSKQQLFPSRADLLKLTPVVLQNQILSVLEAVVFFWIQSPHAQKVPSLSVFLSQISVCFIIGELTFYYGHRVLHLRPLYKRIHHIHHQWKAPFGLTTFYCHPLEQLTANMLPMLLGPALQGCHLLTTYFWYTVVKSVAFYVHSGQAFPWMPLPISRLHDLHHQK